MLVSGNIPSLISGVSQQPQSLRQPSQLDTQENCYPSVVEGLKHRAPSQHIAQVVAGTIGDAFTTLLNRDVLNRFEVVITSGLIKVFDLATGASKTINAVDADATTYITDATPSTTLRAVTIADYTFIINTKKVVASKTDVPAARQCEALVFVSQGEYGSLYQILVNTDIWGAITTSSTVVTDLDTQTIATKLVTAIATVAGTTTEVDTAAYTLTVPTNTARWQTGDSVALTLTSGTITGVATGTYYAIRVSATLIKLATSKVNALANTAIALTAKSSPVWTLGSNEYTITRAGSTIWLQKTTGTFTSTVTDAQGGNSLKVFQTKTMRFSDLPVTAPNGYILSIDANPDTQGGVYFVKFVVNSAGETFAQGTWQECADPTSRYIIDPTTMPYALIHNGDDTFTFSKITWGNKLCGDATSNPMPSFVGQTLNDLYLFKNRLGFIAGENFILSETGQFYNFFRTTVTQLLDSDPVDSRVVNAKVSILRHAIPFASHCMFFSDQTQFRMNGSNSLTPKSSQVDPETAYECNLQAKPVGFGQSLFFGINKGNYNGIRELKVDDVTNTMDAPEESAHVPSYIPAGLFHMSVSTVESVLVMLTTGDPTSIYVYKYFYKNSGPAYGSTKVQSAFLKMPMGGAGTKVLSADFIETKCYILIQRVDGVYLEVIDFTPGLVDPNMNYVTSLDRRITEASLISNTYDSTTNLTTMVLPYAIDGTMIVATRTVTAEIPGRSLQITSSAGSTLTVRGDYHAAPVYIGQKYTKRIILSTIYVRQKSASGADVVDPSGRLQLLRAYLLFDETSYFKILVDQDGRDTSVSTFTGQIAGDSNTMIGQVNLQTGRFKFAIMGKNENVTIEINSDHFLPFRFTGIEWEGQYVKRSRGI